MISFEAQIREVIAQEAGKLVARHQTYATAQADEQERIARRSGVRPPKTVLVPSYWAIDDGFNPYKVRVRTKGIAHAIAYAIRRRRYEPRPAVAYDVPKADGTKRTTAVFQVADNALSRLFFKTLMAKNASRLSGRCYAYRTDITVHDAVAEIAAAFRGRGRLFVAEFDFSKFFDSISHEHLGRILRDKRFFITEREHSVIWTFVKAPTVAENSYNSARGAAPPRDKGIPQGTSLSLFLANLAAFPLDRRLEALGVGFVRYADDTVIWSDSYDRLCDAVRSLEDVAAQMSVLLNLDKSQGISLLTPLGAPAEFANKTYVEFVGHTVTPTVVSFKNSKIREIKRHLAELIFRNLLQEPKRGHVIASRLGPTVDRDYVAAVFQMRRYLYGELTEARLRKYLGGTLRQVHFRGLMSFFPLVDDDATLRKLDGWLVHTIHRTLLLRASYFAGCANPLPPPFGLSKRQLLTLQVRSSTTGRAIDLRLPSFRRMSLLLRKAARQFGANAIAHPRSGQYYPGP